MELVLGSFSGVLENLSFMAYPAHKIKNAPFGASFAL